MTTAEAKREEYAQHVTEKLEAVIRREAPDGIGAWHKVHEYVRDADMDFQRACAKFVLTGTEEDKDAMVDAGVALRDAWRDAARAFEREG